jgi:hypothetical protein
VVFATFQIEAEVIKDLQEGRGPIGVELSDIRVRTYGDMAHVKSMSIIRNQSRAEPDSGRPRRQNKRWRPRKPGSQPSPCRTRAREGAPGLTTCFAPGGAQLRRQPPQERHPDCTVAVRGDQFEPKLCGQSGTMNARPARVPPRGSDKASRSGELLRLVQVHARRNDYGSEPHILHC